MKVVKRLRWRRAGVAGFASAAGLAMATVAAGATTTPVTFTKDVAPILQEKCQECHQPGSIAPMSLITYEDARPWARAIREKVVQREMPPWHIDKSVGIQKFKNDFSLNDDQIATLVNWVDEGAPKGDPADMPAPRKLDDPNAWRGVIDGLGQPDLVITSPTYTMPAVHQDVWWRPEQPIPITEARWVRAVEIRPATVPGRKIMHHIIAYRVLNADEADEVNTGTGRGGAGLQIVDSLVNARPQLMEWAIGKGYDEYRPDTGKRIEPGEKISWEMHIHAAGEPITSGAQIALWFYPKGQEPHHRSYLVGFQALGDRTPGSSGLDIRPNALSMSEGFTTLRKPAILENFQPHMHLRGKAMELEAILPTGEHQVVSFIRNFNFNWMTNYVYADDAAPAFPAGTVIHVTAWYDNTTGNRNNPDPNQWVGYGNRTVDEMGHAWVNVTYLSDEEYADWVKQHAQKPARVTQQQ
jgi:hypothetical protein